MKTRTFSCLAAMTSAISRSRCELAAVGLAPRAVAEPLRRMVADLLEPHQERRGPALDARCPRVDASRSASSSTDFLVERGLHAREMAERLHLGLVRQIVDDGFVSLQTPRM